MSDSEPGGREVHSEDDQQDTLPIHVTKEEVQEEEYTDHIVGEDVDVNELGEMVDQEVVEEEVLEESVLHEHDLIEEGEAIEIEYLEDDGTVGEEVVIEDGMVMEEDDIATESLVALSRGPGNKDKTVREFIQQTVPLTGKVPRPSPRILRRPPAPAPYHAPRHYVGWRPAQSQNIQKPNYPVPQTTKRLLPVATVPAGAGGSKTQNGQNDKQNDWREEQKRLLEIYEIYDCLPDHMREPFRRVLDSSGKAEIPPVRGQPAARRQQGGRMSAGSDSFRSDRASLENENNKRGYRQMEVNDGGESSQQYSRMMVIPQDEDAKKEGQMQIEEVEEAQELEDMPQLEEIPVPEMPMGAGQGQQRQQIASDAQIDVEGYDSGDDPDIRAGVEYVMEPEEMEMYERGGPLKSSYMRHIRNSQIIMPGMREDYYGAVDMNSYSANQMMVNNQIPEARFCPGCKMSLKRSVFYHHSRMIKKYGVCNMFTPKRFPCGFDTCGERLGTVEKLCEHMWQIHGSPTEIKTEVFHSEDEFDVFLRELESKGGNFRMSRGNKMIKAGLVQYYRCNRMQSVAKDKTTRICDEIGLYGENPVRPTDRKDEDPFTVLAGKPCIRTEEACTAFFRKAYLPNNTIEVRYCDHHLHEDERVRLPIALKERIFEMHRKKLPFAVIMMVLQHEKDKFSTPGSAIEKRIMALTPKDIASTLQTKPPARKGRQTLVFANPEADSSVEVMSVENERRHHAGMHQNNNQSTGETVAISMDRQIPGVAAMEEVLEEADADDNMEAPEPSSSSQGAMRARRGGQLEHGEEDDNLAPPPRTRTTIVHGEPLNEVEQQMLETYEANHAIILTDMQKMKRSEAKKKNQREGIRNKVFALGRFIKTMNFAEMPLEKLEEMADGLQTVIGVTRARCDPDAYPISIPRVKQEHLKQEHLDQFGNSIPILTRQEPDFEPSPRAKKRKVVEDDETTEVNVHAEEEEAPPPVIPEPRAASPEESLVPADDHEQIIVEADAAPTSTPTPYSPATKKARRGRPRKEIKKEAADESPTEPVDAPPPPVISLPSRTRTGRVVRPRTIVDV